MCMKLRCCSLTKASESRSMIQWQSEEARDAREALTAWSAALILHHIVPAPADAVESGALEVRMRAAQWARCVKPAHTYTSRCRRG